jgi:hypothetical protein
MATTSSGRTWGDIFGDDVMAAALIDRLVYHCHLVTIRGNSYRMRQHSELRQTLHTVHESESNSGGRRRRTPARQEATTTGIRVHSRHTSSPTRPLSRGAIRTSSGVIRRAAVSR